MFASMLSPIAARPRDLQMLMPDPSNVWFTEWCAWFQFFPLPDESMSAYRFPPVSATTEFQIWYVFSWFFRPPNLVVPFSSHISETGILQDGSMRISYDEFRFYIYDMLGSNKARQLGVIWAYISSIIETRHFSWRKNRQCWKVPSLEKYSISKYIQFFPIVRSGCSVFQRFGYFSNSPGALLFNGANNKNSYVDGHINDMQVLEATAGNEIVMQCCLLKLATVLFVFIWISSHIWLIYICTCMLLQCT